MRFQQQNFTFYEAVPIGHGRGAEAETMANDGLEIILHQPSLDQGAIRERSPDFFRRVWHFSFHDESACRSGIRHLSILFNRFSS